MTNLHFALKTTIVGSHNGDGINYILVRLQTGKDNFIDTLHARPNSHSTSGFQSTDFLPCLALTVQNVHSTKANVSAAKFPRE